MVQKAGNEGKVDTEEWRFRWGRGTSFLGGVKVLLNCHHPTLPLAEHSDVNGTVVEVGKGGNLACGHLLALVNLHCVEEVVDLHHAGLISYHLLLLYHQALELSLSKDTG